MNNESLFFTSRVFDFQKNIFFYVQVTIYSERSFQFDKELTYV